MDPDERSNALKITTCDLFHGTGMGLVALLTVLPLLFSFLGARPLELGVLASIGTAGWIVGQPVGLFLVGRRRRTKGFFVRWVLSLWVPAHLAMAVAVHFLGPADERLCRYALLFLFAVVMVGDGMVIPLWTDWQGSLFGRGSRGRAMGLIAGAWAFGQFVGALGAGKVQDHLLFPLNYSVLFLGASLLFAASSGLLWRVREPDRITSDRASLEVADLLRRLRRSLGQSNFRTYVISKVLLALGGGAAAYYAVHFKSWGGGLTDSTVIKLGALTALSYAVSSNVLGRLGDRVGHKRAVAFGYLAQLTAIAVAYVGQGWFACAACFVTLGVALSAGWVSHVNMLFETCPHDSRVAHITLSNTVLAPFVLLAPLGTGWLIEQVGMRNGIGLTLIPTGAALLWLVLFVKEPRLTELAQRPVGPGVGE